MNKLLHSRFSYSFYTLRNIPTAEEMKIQYQRFDSPYGRGVRFRRAVEYYNFETKKSYKDIAKDIGVSYSTLRRWTDGAKIDEKYYPAIESILNLKIDWIFDGYPAHDPRSGKSMLSRKLGNAPGLPYCNLEDYQTWFLNYISQAEIDFKNDIENARKEIKSWDLPKKEDKV